jgi:hypothetical protein
MGYGLIGLEYMSEWAPGVTPYLEIRKFNGKWLKEEKRG